jgi:hypothetical protein
MKACLLATLSILVASSSLAQLPYTEKQVIAYAKSIDVKTLDPSLPLGVSKTGSSPGRRTLKSCFGK